MKNKPFVTVHVITYNEEIIIEFLIKHYRRMFPNCIIKVHDNYSNDKTVEIAKLHDCEIIYYSSVEGPDKLDDREFKKIKNESWKYDTTDWVLCCDADELLYITQDELKTEENLGKTIIRTTGYYMINNKNNVVDLEGMEYGFQDDDFSKPLLFNKKFITKMDYCTGGHEAFVEPYGIKVGAHGYPGNKHNSATPYHFEITKQKVSDTAYTMGHFRFLSISHSKAKAAAKVSRWSDWNLKHMDTNIDSLAFTNTYFDEWYSKALVKVPNLKKNE